MPAPTNGIVSTREYVSTNKEVILKILKVWFKIIQYMNQNLDEGGSIIIEILNANSAADFSIGDFREFWNNYEHYPSSLAEIEEDILSQSGSNYWKSRWDDCNEYFFNIKNVIPRPINYENAFLMIEIHEELKQKYKNEVWLIGKRDNENK